MEIITQEQNVVHNNELCTKNEATKTATNDVVEIVKENNLIPLDEMEFLVTYLRFQIETFISSHRSVRK